MKRCDSASLQAIPGGLEGSIGLSSFHPLESSSPFASALAKARDVMVAERDADVLDLAVEVEAVVAAVAAHTAALRAAERRVQVAHVLGVDPDHARFQTFRHAVAAAQVLR